MELELEHTRSLIRDLRNGVVKDIRVECIDGNTEISSVLVSARSTVFKRMLDGTFKEGEEKLIRFPTAEIRTVERALNYIQYGEINSSMNLRDIIEDYKFAHLYDIQGYLLDLKGKLNKLASHVDVSARLYTLCGNSPALAEFKDMALICILDDIDSPKITFACQKCVKLITVVSKCSVHGCLCKPILINKKGLKCEFGNPIKCEDLNCTKKPCDGMLKVYHTLHTVTHMPESDQLEIFNKYIERVLIRRVVQ